MSVVDSCVTVLKPVWMWKHPVEHKELMDQERRFFNKATKDHNFLPFSKKYTKSAVPT